MSNGRSERCGSQIFSKSNLALDKIIAVLGMFANQLHSTSQSVQSWVKYPAVELKHMLGVCKDLFCFFFFLS